MAHSKQRDLALQITHKLRDAGYEALWAGGCVRDQLLGLEPKDYDVATNARPEQVQELFGKRRTLAIGAAFGVIAVLSKDCQPVEVATFRNDGAYVDGRRPSSVEFSTAEQDAQRRDLTINGMFFDPLAEQVIDYVGGQADLGAGVIRAIGDARARFAEDKLRMLRAVRFATTLNFVIESQTLTAIHEMADEVKVVSAERIGAELGRLLIHPQRASGMRLIYQSRLLHALMPEVAKSADENSPSWHGTLQILERLESSDLGTALAALTCEFSNQLQATRVGRQFRFANRDIELATWLVKNLPTVANAEQLPWPRLQRVLIHDGALELLALAQAKWGKENAGLVRCLHYLALPPEKLNPTPLITGDDLVRHGYQPGPHFAAILTMVRDAQLEGRINSEGEALELVKQWQARMKHS